MPKNNKYLAWLQDKNLAPGTIRSYLDARNQFPTQFSTSQVKEYFRTNLKKYAVTTLKVRKYALNSYINSKSSKLNEKKSAD